MRRDHPEDGVLIPRQFALRGNQRLIAANQVCIEPVSVVPNPSLDGVHEDSVENEFRASETAAQNPESPAKPRQKLGQRPKITR